MRTIARAFGIVALGSLLPLAAQVTETTEETDVQEHADGSVTETSTTTTTTFDPEVQTRVVKYFGAYKAQPYGLPPAWVTKVRVKDAPAVWRTTRIAPGVIVTEKERPYLFAAPLELIKVLPAPTPEVRYYVAGGNVVAVDKSYRVVDSFQIPSVKITVDE